MSASKHIDKICCTALIFSLILTLFFTNAETFGIQEVSAAAGYASRLFQTSVVHTIDIVMDDWDSFIENCTDEQYTACTVVIDGEAFRNVAIRAKGNTSLTSVKSYGNDRYSFKIEFDHYDDSINYYGLDKLCLNNIIQDNTYMKDYITYRMMREFGADAPLCSYSYITVNGSDWGLYLAVEGVEDAFLQRNYGNSEGQLYKPDSMDMGGGRGNGRNFDMPEMQPGENENSENAGSMPSDRLPSDRRKTFDDSEPPAFERDMLPDGQKDRPPERSDSASGGHDRKAGPMGTDHVMGSSDVALIYTDEDFESYSNILDNAKTNPSDADKTRLIQTIQKLNNSEDLENILDIDEVIRYFVVHNFVLNFDSYTGSLIHNYYLYEENGQLSMIPWDYNLAFGGFESQSDATSLINYPIDTPVSGGTIESRPMLAWIFAHEEYTEKYHTYFEQFIAEYFDNGHLETLIDSTQEMIAPYVERDPTKFCTYEEFCTGTSVLKDFCMLRAESIEGQLSGLIPSTSEGQAQNSSSLIDASGLDVPAMGAMDKNRIGH